MLSAKLVKNATLKVYKGYSHGMATTHAEEINKDLLAFIHGEQVGDSSSVSPSVVAEPLPA